MCETLIPGLLGEGNVLGVSVERHRVGSEIKEFYKLLTLQATLQLFKIA